MKINTLDRCPADAAGIPAFLDSNEVGFTGIDCINWPGQYPAKPSARFRIAACPSHLLLEFSVMEDRTVAAVSEDNGNVWEDSCVEFFLMLPGDDSYFNIECNCIGSLLIGHGPGKTDRRLLSPDLLKSVGRFTTLERKPFEERPVGSWGVALMIPTAVFGIPSLQGITLKANAYKCGDSLSTPHFLSWQPIKTENPDFHRPEFFGVMEFSR